MVYGVLYSLTDDEFARLDAISGVDRGLYRRLPLKVTTDSGWFAARPSGTEDIYKLYAESLKGEEHLEQIIEEARGILG